MIAQFCRKSAGTLMKWWGTKNDRIMNSPIPAVSNSGTSRFTPAPSLRHHPRRESVNVKGLEHAAHDDRHDDDDLDEVRALERADELGLARQIRARGEQLLT